VKKLMVFGICVVMVSVIALSACTEITQSGEAANTSNTEEVNNTPKKTESPKVATEATIKVTTKPLEPQTPGKVSRVPVEQSPDVFDDVVERDEMLKGEDITFTLESKYCSYQYKLPENQIFIIRSSDELIIANKAAFQEGTVDYASGDKYNDDYFKENALVFFIMKFGNGSYRMRVDSLVKNHNELSFNITVSIPEANIWIDDSGQICVAGTGSSMDMIGNYIELKKSEISNVEFVSYFSTFKIC